MIWEINGVDFSDTVMQGGLEWEYDDIDSRDAGRTTMDGKMHRARITSKLKWKVKCMPLSQERAQQLLKAIYPETIRIRTVHPVKGLCTLEYYSNNRTGAHLRTQEDGTEVWSGISYPVTEV